MRGRYCNARLAAQTVRSHNYTGRADLIFESLETVGVYSVMEGALLSLVSEVGRMACPRSVGVPSGGYAVSSGHRLGKAKFKRTSSTSSHLWKDTGLVERTVTLRLLDLRVDCGTPSVGGILSGLYRKRSP